MAVGIGIWWRMLGGVGLIYGRFLWRMARPSGIGGGWEWDASGSSALHDDGGQPESGVFGKALSLAR